MEDRHVSKNEQICNITEQINNYIYSEISDLILSHSLFFISLKQITIFFEENQK